MRTSTIRNMTVITVPEGEIVGTVNDVLLHAVEQCVGALVINSNQFNGLQIVLVEDISSIGEDAVAIIGTDGLKDQTLLGESNQMVSANDAYGFQVATVSGNYAGKLSDIKIDTNTKKISGFEVTGGLFARIFGVTHTIEANEHTSLGKDLLIIADEVIPSWKDLPPVPDEEADTPLAL